LAQHIARTKFFPMSNLAVKEGYLRAGLLVLEGLGLDGADAHDCGCVRGYRVWKRRKKKKGEECFLSEELRESVKIE
jgi:hypothetical protein